MKHFLLFLSFCSILSCKEHSNSERTESNDVVKDSTLKEREYSVLDSKILDVDQLWEPFNQDLYQFTDTDYTRVKNLAFEKTIPEIQNAIAEAKLTYEDLVLFYLTRIKKYDRNNELSLNSVIALNPNVITEARKLDLAKKEIDSYSIYGMPILLKDNINASGMPTTAGAVAFENNKTEDAFITKQLKANGGN